MLAERLGEAIGAAGLSIREFHRRLKGVAGSSYPSIHRYLRGKADPPGKFVVHAAKVLDVLPGWLLNGKVLAHLRKLPVTGKHLIVFRSCWMMTPSTSDM
jgi:transcriptional regulator with XRE-family HTH domain